MTDLQSQLDAITQRTRSLVQADRLAVADDAIAALHATAIEDRILAVGDEAPSFALADCINGKLIRSDDLLAVGPLVLLFFRGRWCPYDMTELETWQQLYPEVRARGGLLVAVSPQLPRQNDFTVQQHSLGFPVLSDPGNTLAHAFRLTYTVPEPMQRHFRSILVNIPYINGDQTWQLPLPATFVIARDGRIRFAEAHADHRVRPDTDLVLRALDAHGFPK